MKWPDWTDPVARLGWLNATLLTVLRQEDQPTTMPRLTYLVNCVSNPKRRKKKGEYKFPHEEVESALDRLVTDYVLEVNDQRHKYDPSTGRRRYWFRNLLEVLAQASA